MWRKDVSEKRERKNDKRRRVEGGERKKERTRASFPSVPTLTRSIAESFLTDRAGSKKV